MTIKVAINGYGRIGRNILRAKYESGYDDIRIVAINDLGDAASNAHLTRYDTAHGRFPGRVEVADDALEVNGERIAVFAERDPARLPWGDLGVDVVHECTGFFASKDKASAHITAGAKKAIVSAPAGADVDATVVYGVNHETLKAAHTVISNASCTTNCLAPLARALNDSVGIVHGLMNTVHAYTNDQVLTDVYHSDLRRARSATQSMIPTKTGAAAAVGMVLPELDGKLDGKVCAWYDNEWGFSNRMLDTTVALMNAA
ncbi:MAG: type I glyceraldehyde-3-phosphate dehydrogenase [Gammaproteobacteria bacterium]|nr:type I glyceraldehyde-3-phosphate dehydrogenase [Gammaproteobacteria bacterium]